MLKLCFYIFCCECNSIRFMYVCMSGTKNSWLLKDSTECTQVLKGVDNICTIYTWNMHNICTIYAQYMQSICTTYKYMFNSCTTFAYKLTNIFPKIFWINIKGMPKIAQGLQQGIIREYGSSQHILLNPWRGVATPTSCHCWLEYFLVWICIYSQCIHLVTNSW